MVHTFARLSVMAPGELAARGCPQSQITPLLDFALRQATRIAAPVVEALREIDHEATQQTSAYIARVAQLLCGTPESNKALVEWIVAGFGHMPADLRRDPRVRQLRGLRERRQ